MGEMKQTRDTYGILGGVLDAREVARSTQVRLRCVSVGKPLNLELFVNNYLTMPPARYMPRCERPYEHPYEHRTNDGKNTVRTTRERRCERRCELRCELRTRTQPRTTRRARLRKRRPLFKRGQNFLICLIGNFPYLSSL